MDNQAQTVDKQSATKNLFFGRHNIRLNVAVLTWWENNMWCFNLPLGAVHKWRHHFWGVSRPPPPPCHYVMTKWRHHFWGVSRPPPSPSSDDVIYEQPLMRRRKIAIITMMMVTLVQQLITMGRTFWWRPHYQRLSAYSTEFPPTAMMIPPFVNCRTPLQYNTYHGLLEDQFTNRRCWSFLLPHIFQRLYII